ncbi:MAG: DMT family transporter [Bdellovibrio bacteriovorus]
MASPGQNRSGPDGGPGLLVLAAALPPLFWAGNFILGRALHAEIQPLALSFWRWALALLILLPFSYWRLVSQWAAVKASWPILSLLALLGVTNYNTFAYIGLQTTTATNAVLLTSTTPVLILALSWMLLRRHISPAQGLGMALSLAGVAVIVSEGDPARLAAVRLTSGDLWILAAGLDWALYSVCLRWRPADLDPLVFLTATVAIGTLPLAGLYGWDLWQGNRFDLTPANLAALGYVALFPSVLAYVIWNRSVAELGANRTGQYIHLLPVFGALLAVVLLGERWQWVHGAGVSLIALGLWLSSRHDRPARGRA